MPQIPFNRPLVAGHELEYIRQAIANRHLSGNGPFTVRCQEWLQRRLGAPKALLTHSCTAALEMAAILAGVGPGDEVIMPSFTFVSTANAFVLRGATPVFVDIREDTCNIDQSLIESAITPKTKAIVPVHYAGVACDMDRIGAIARQHHLMLIEDAAQGVMSTYRGRPLGTLSDLAALSFHETKNVIAGEGGALVVNDERWALRSEVVWEKGTNRTQFFRGSVDKYTWVDIGSSYLPSEINAAFLLAQLEAADDITARRLEIWACYHEAFEQCEREGIVRRPIVPAECHHNAHMYYLLFRDAAHRVAVQAHLRDAGVDAVFHYVPLHSSPAGRTYGRTAGSMTVTDSVAGRLLRLPLWVGMTEDDIHRVAQHVSRALGEVCAG
jgi:dTDP-4-amino-4,6-dideoxygalactose transaminase